jgi:hypothetical protein
MDIFAISFLRPVILKVASTNSGDLPDEVPGASEAASFGGQARCPPDGFEICIVVPHYFSVKNVPKLMPTATAATATKAAIEQH